MRWTPAPVLALGPAVPTGMTDPAIARAAAGDRRVRDLLYWSRLPFAAIGDGRVTIGDARYAGTPADGRFSVVAPIR